MPDKRRPEPEGKADHLHIHVHLDPVIERMLGTQFAALNQQLEIIMATLDEVVAKVTEEDTAIDSLIALVQGLKGQLDDVLSGVTLPPGVQAKVDAIFSAVEDNPQRIQDAIDANTPPA